MFCDLDQLIQRSVVADCKPSYYFRPRLLRSAVTLAPKSARNCEVTSALHMVPE